MDSYTDNYSLLIGERAISYAYLYGKESVDTQIQSSDATTSGKVTQKEAVFLHSWTGEL